MPTSTPPWRADALLARAAALISQEDAQTTAADAEVELEIAEMRKTLRPTDRIGRRPAFTLFMIGATAVVPIFAFGARSVITLLIVGPLVGYFAHGYFSMFGAMLAELFPTRIRASAQGFCYNTGRLASVAAPFAIGAASTKHGLGFAIACDAVFFGLGAILIWLLPERGTEL